ncbi:head GIN domain-containing protein [Nanoarchaeota archaeon]
MKYLIPIIALTIILISGCNLNCIGGSGNVISEERTISGFDSVQINGAGNVYYTQGELTPLIIEGDDNLLPEVATYVSGSTLVIDYKQCIRNHRPIEVTVSSENIKKLAIAGSGKIETMNEISTDNLEIKIEGSGNIKVKGEANNLNTIIQGSGKIETYDLLTQNSKALIQGSGNIHVNAQEELDVTIEGSGTVLYKGNPRTSQKVSGSGTIRNVD